MEGRYSQSNDTILFFSYICRLRHLNFTTDVEVATVSGSHLTGKTNEDVNGIHFKCGTMYSIPYGIGNFFSNLIAVVAGDGYENPITFNNIKRPSLANLDKLSLLSIFAKEIGEVDNDALWDLPVLRDFLLCANGSISLHENTFKKNEYLREVVFLSTELKDIPTNLFSNNLLLEAVYLQRCSLESIDEGLFESNKNLGLVSLSSNKIEHLPGNLFKNNLLLEVIDLADNALKTVDVDFTIYNHIDIIDLEDNSCIDAYYESDDHRYDDAFTNLTELQSVIKANCSASVIPYNILMN